MKTQKYHKLFHKIGLPEYINCNSEVITHCDWYMHKDCKETCNYARDIGGIGIGGADEGLVDRLKESREWIE